MSEFRRLQEIYVHDFEGMNIDDMRLFLELTKTNPDAPYRDQRIRRLTERVRNYERQHEYERSRKEHLHQLALEYKAMTEEWEAAGATWEGKESLVRWFYKGQEFYHWWSRVLVEEEAPRARKAHERFKALRDSEGEHDIPGQTTIFDFLEE